MKNKINKKIKERMSFLISILNKWNYEYYTLNESSVSDEKYDKYFKELKKIEEKYKVLNNDSPTKKIFFFPEKQIQLINRKKPMLSLESISNFEGILKFDKKIKKKLNLINIDYLCEWKIDGISLSITYKNNYLEKISTRGNGEIGEDITFNKYLIKNIPDYLKEIDNCEVRGEAYMKKNDFEELNKKLKKEKKKTLSNPRNAVSGTLRNLKKFEEERKVFFSAYSLFDKKMESQKKCLEKLREMKFFVDPDYQICENIDKVCEFIKNKEKKRKILEFESDGIVIKINKFEYQEILGNNNTFPKWAIAYKFIPSSFSSKIKKICSKVSKNGRITYIANLEPFFLKGSKISNVTLHNYSFIKKMNININDEVLIKKSGDIIPQIVKVIKKEKIDFWIPPEFCSCCKKKLEWNETKIYQICYNQNCSQKNVNYLSFFTSKKGLNIKGINKKIIEKFYKEKILITFSDFYKLKEKKEIIKKIDGFKEKSINKILESIEESKKKPFYFLLSSLGIPSLSILKSKKLSNYYSDFSFINFLEEWKKIKDLLGEKTQKEMKNYFQNEDNIKLIKELEKLRK